MKYSRSHQSMSSASSRSCSSERSRRSPTLQSDDLQKPKSSRKMKCIIMMGIALPLIAAIIGIVAWAVSAESVLPGPVSSSLRRSDTNMGHEEDILQLFEDRQDIDYTTHMNPLFQSPDNQQPRLKDLSRVDEIQNVQHQDSYSEHSQEKDPLYIVHFVPSPKPRSESSTLSPELGSTVSSEVLKKILSASKGNKPGIPQFVVFAPVPGEEDSNIPNNGMSNGGNAMLNLFANNKQPNINNGELDYEYEEELRKHQEMVNSNPPLTDASRGGDSKEINSQNSKQRSQYHKKSVKIAAQNFTSGTHIGRSVTNIGSHVNYQHPSLQDPQNPVAQQSQQSVLQQLQDPASHQSQQSILQQLQNAVSQQSQQSVLQQHHNSVPQESHLCGGQQCQHFQQSIPQQSQQCGGQQCQQSQHSFPQQPQQSTYQQPPLPVLQQPQPDYRQALPQDYSQMMPQSFQPAVQPASQFQNSAPQQSFPPQQVSATARAGEYAGPAIKLSLGGGSPKTIFGPGYSPLGIIGSILAPILPKAQLDVKGKMMFGVMLENGLKLGGHKPRLY